MSAKAPYQPSLLRLLHGISGLALLIATATGYWIYDQFDGRWGRIGLPQLDSIMDWHHDIAGKAILIFILFGLYSLTLGRHKLIQQSSLKHLTQINTPIWWQGLHRLVNTTLLGAIVLAVISGREMQGNWLVTGDYQHGVYFVHLAAWGTIVLGLILHLLMNLKIGGIPLLLSIFSLKLRPHDTPKHWPQQIQTIWKRH
jgi:Ni,Fe-hydrogenase I cytochrome b subunit